MKKLALLCVISVLTASCVTTDRCSVKINKSKFNYYNKLQYGGNTAYVNKAAKKKR